MLIRRPTGTRRSRPTPPARSPPRCMAAGTKARSAPTSPDLAGKWGVYLMPSLTADGPRAANLGGSSLAITSASQNKEAACAYLNYTLGTNEGQITMLKEFGLVPSLISRARRSVRLAGAALLGRPDGVGGHPVDAAEGRAQPRHAVPAGRRHRSLRATQLKYLGGGYPDAKAALDDAANQIAAATGLPAIAPIWAVSRSRTPERHRAMPPSGLLPSSARPRRYAEGGPCACAHGRLRLPDALSAGLPGLLGLADHQLVLDVAS